MARVRDVGAEEVPEDDRPIYERFAHDYGPFMNQARVFAHRPPILRHMMGLMLTLADEAIVPKRYLEIALVTVSKLNTCTYCVTHHVPRLIEQGLPPDTANNILAPDCPGLDDVDRLVRDYARQVTLDSKRVPNQLFEALRAHFTEAQIVELTFRTTLCGFYNRLNEALAIDIEPEAIEEMLSKGGAAAA